MTRALLAAAVLAGCTQTPVGVGGEPVSTRAAAPTGTTSATGSALRKAHPWPLRAVSRSRASSPVRDRVPTASRSRSSALLAGTGLHLNWPALAKCESGNDPQANTGNGYYGAYQFTLDTWASVGGRGLPSAAPLREQTYRAELLYGARGRSPWPVCGRRL